MQQILTRRNSIIGRLYADEPAILPWELTNEARCQVQGGRELLLDWTREMALFAKQWDANHLLALGDEGFFYQRDRGHLHFYPQAWGYAHDLAFAERWISDPAEVAVRANKPAILEEFGLKLDGGAVRTAEDRDYWFAKWMEAIREAGVSGALFWMIGQKSADTAGYVDDYVIDDAEEVPAIVCAAAAMTGVQRVIPGGLRDWAK